MRSTLLAALLLLLVDTPLGADELPYPPGRSSQSLQGLQVELGLPAELSKDKPASLIVILHGAGGTATGMAASLSGWIPRGYVVCAPKSKGQVWSTTDIEAVKRIAAHLKGVLPIDAAKVHVVGFSNGGWNLDPLAFDDELKPCSATWVAAGCKTGGPPKWAREHLGVLAMAGSQDGNAGAAAGTVKLLRDKVRSVEVRYQPGLGHEWPRELMPYFRWWMDAMDGRFTPGEDLNFDWGESIPAAVSVLADRKKGGVLVYAWSAEDKDKEHAKALQNEVMMDPLVRHYGSQLQAVKLDFAQHREALEALGVKETPALIVLKKDGKPKKVLQGERAFKTSKVAAAVKSVAPNKKKPE